MNFENLEIQQMSMLEKMGTEEIPKIRPIKSWKDWIWDRYSHETFLFGALAAVLLLSDILE